MKGNRPRVCVVGSLVADLVFRVRRRPEPGETLSGAEFGLFLGGKGFNQAVGAGRLGAEVTMVGRVGQDHFGDLFLAKMRAEGMTTEFIARDPAAGTGVASPIVTDGGENSIVGAPRANMKMTVEQVEQVRAAIAAADILLLQFEIPQECSWLAAAIARENGTLVQLDPAPAHFSPTGRTGPTWPTDYIVPNENEVQMLAGGQTVEKWARAELAGGAKAAVVSMGVYGAVVHDARGVRQHPAYSISAVDTTGAGDAFRAGMAVRLAEGASIDEAVKFANACGALACLTLGAEPSMPMRRAVEDLMTRKGPSAEGPSDRAEEQRWR
jgi:ribokinase